MEKASKKDTDIIILNIVDGLSYYDLNEDTEAMPCLVNGVTKTVTLRAIHLPI